MSFIALAAIVVVVAPAALAVFVRARAPHKKRGRETNMNAEELNFAALSIWRGFRNGTFYGARGSTRF